MNLVSGHIWFLFCKCGGCRSPFSGENRDAFQVIAA